MCYWGHTICHAPICRLLCRFDWFLFQLCVTEKEKMLNEIKEKSMFVKKRRQKRLALCKISRYCISPDSPVTVLFCLAFLRLYCRCVIKNKSGPQMVSWGTPQIRQTTDKHTAPHVVNEICDQLDFNYCISNGSKPLASHLYEMEKYIFHADKALVEKKKGALPC